MNSGIGGVIFRLIGLELLLLSTNGGLLMTGLSETGLEGYGLEDGSGEDEVNVLFIKRRSSMLSAWMRTEGSPSIELARLGTREPARELASVDNWEADRMRDAGR